jgi:PAS domain S-box-containing protein
LCVDDQETDRHTRGRILRNAGFQVVEAADGASALRLAAEVEPCLVLLDVRLPDLNGFEVCKRLRSDPRTSSIPVLHVSGLEPEALVAMIGALIRARQDEKDCRTSGAENALPDRGEEFRTLANSIPQLCWMANPDGWITWYNQRWYDYTGATREQMEGWGWQSVHDPDVLPVVIERWKDAVARGVPLDMTFPLRGSDGAYRPFLTRVVPVRDATGQITRWFGTNTDISEQRRSEDALRESRAKLEAALASMTDALCILDADGRFIDFNDAFATFYRFRSKEECARTFAEYPAILDVCLPDGAPAPLEMWAIPRALRGEKVAYTEFLLRRKDTGESWVGSYSFGPIRDGDGEIVGCVMVARDITERKRAEEAVRESREELRQRLEELETVMAVAPVAIFVAHDKECNTITGNPMANALYESGPDENVSRNVTSVRRFFQGGRELRAEELPMQVAAAKGIDVRDSELDMMLPSGRKTALMGQASPLWGADGTVRGCVGAFLDITEHKRSEERLRRAQKLESIGLLAGGIAHDFNNLLTGILGHASLLQSELGPGAAARVNEIVQSAERAAHLTRELLAYSGKGQFVLRDLDVSRAVNEIADLVHFSIPKNIELAIAAQSRLPRVRLDPGQLQQILMNLVINAGEAIGEGVPGRITIATSLVDLDKPFVDATGVEVRPGRYVSVEVSDTGSGVSEEHRAKIFEPFFTTKFTGRGLGLAAVAGILRSQKGAMMLESVPGSGSTFRVLLPVAHEQRSASYPVGGEERATILVVDDEETVRRFIGEALRRKGYCALLASDGREALAVCERERGEVAAAIVDIVMPIMGANDLLPAIKARYPRMRLLLTSGYSESEARRLCAAYPGAVFIQKPYTAQQILDAAEKLLETSGD